MCIWKIGQEGYLCPVCAPLFVEWGTKKGQRMDA